MSLLTITFVPCSEIAFHLYWPGQNGRFACRLVRLTVLIIISIITITTAIIHANIQYHVLQQRRVKIYRKHLSNQAYQISRQKKCYFLFIQDSTTKSDLNKKILILFKNKHRSVQELRNTIILYRFGLVWLSLVTM